MGRLTAAVPSLSPKDADRVGSVLIRGPNWIGDAVMCEPAMAALRELFPRARLTLLVKPVIAQLFRDHPGLDRILVYDDPGAHSGLAGKWTLARSLRAERFDVALLFQNAFEAALLAALAGIPRRYGYATDGRRFLLTDAIPAPKRALRPHQVRYYLDLLSPLGIQGRAADPRLYVSDEESQAFDRRLKDLGVGIQDVLIGVNPGSTYGGAKRWLPERFAETADRLAREVAGHSRDPVRTVIIGAPGEERLGESIVERMSTGAVSLAGRTNLRELMAAVKRCRLFLTNDTGPMHIAAAFGVPIVAVFGPTDWRTTSPAGGNHRIVRQEVDCAPCLLRECPIDHRCMTGVTVEHVLDAARDQLEADKLARDKRASKSPEQWAAPQLTRQAGPLVGIPVFLDRDGTLNRDSGYVKTPEELEVLPGVADAIACLNAAGAVVVLVTNQSGIGRGLFSPQDLERVHERLRQELARGGARLDAIYYCPHHPDEGCDCRKPGTGMVDRAAAELALDPSRGYLVGDQPRDIDMARRIGARSVLVLTGQTSHAASRTLSGDGLEPDHLADGLVDAIQWILEDARARCAVEH